MWSSSLDRDRLQKSLESKIYKFLCPSDAFILGLTRVPATPSRFQNVQKRDLSVHGWGAKTSADAFFYLRMHHASFMASHVCTSESHLVLEVFQVLARRGVEARCAQHVLPEVMISPKDLIWTGGTFDPGSIPGRCSCPKLRAMNFL